MRTARVFIWVYPALVLAIGLGFLVWSYFQAADADAYRRASQCAGTVTSSCYEVFTGVLSSVQVSQSRSGERDDVVIKTGTAGDLSATLDLLPTPFREEELVFTLGSAWLDWQGERERGPLRKHSHA